MGSKVHTRINFKPPFKGTGYLDNGFELPIGVSNKETKPYDLLLNALGACLYATFYEIIEKKKISFDDLNIEISGEKKEEVPTTLKNCNIIFKITNPSKEKGLDKSLDLACKYCSVYQTIAKVAIMDHKLIIE